MDSKRVKKFTDLYDKLSYMYGSVDVFIDFVKMSAISIYNSFAKDSEMEQEYLRTINKYEKEYQDIFPQMLAELIMACEETDEIVDILGPFYERENLGNSHLGQFFTPTHISEFMTEILLESQDKLNEIIELNGFISILEPACGAGRPDFSYGQNIKKAKHRLSKRYTCSCNRYIRCLCLYDIYSIIFVRNTSYSVLWRYVKTRNSF